MEPPSFNSQACSLEAATGPDSHSLFVHYYLQYPPECGAYQEDQYTSFVFDDHVAYPPSTQTRPLAGFDESEGYVVPGISDPGGGYAVPGTLGSLEEGKLFAQQLATIPLGKTSTCSELTPHVAAQETTVLLKRGARATVRPQLCVSPTLCQGHPDLPECTETDDEPDCPGEPAADFEAEPSDEEDHPQPPPSPHSSPSPPPSRFLSPSLCEPPSPSHGVVRSGRAKNRYSPMEAKAPLRKGKLVTKHLSYRSDDEPKPRKRRDAVSLACLFCRGRKIACRQPPPGSPDRTCTACKVRGSDCEYPTESRRGAPSGYKHAH